MKSESPQKRFIAWKGHAWIALLARLGLAGIFLLACFHKIADPAAFALSIATYDILPTSLVNGLAIGLPWVELTAGLMLLFGFRARAGILLVSTMMLMFIIALSVALFRGLDMSCGCFASGETGDSISILTLFRDLSLLFVALYTLLCDRLPIGLDRWLALRKTSGGSV